MLSNFNSHIDIGHVKRAVYLVEVKKDARSVHYYVTCTVYLILAPLLALIVAKLIAFFKL